MIKNSKMKKTILIIVTAFITAEGISQSTYTQQMISQVAKLDEATNVKAYQQLANEFLQIAMSKKGQWLPYYYASFCNARIGWLLENDPDNIEPYADKAEEQAKKAQSLLDTSTQKKELSELYCIMSMINRARVFINPQTYGPEYGPRSNQYTKRAEVLDPGNPRALYLAGWEKFVTPKMWGGDKVKAKQLLEEAEQKLVSNEVQGIEPHWGKKEVDVILKELK